MDHNQHILISGGGIAGPALAYWLHQYGFKVTIVEKALAIRKGGYRVDIRGAGVQVVEKMGLLDEVRQHSTTLGGSSMIDNSGKRIVNLDDPDIFGMRQAGDAEIMRGDLVNILYEATKTFTDYIFDDQIEEISQNATGVEAIFKSGAQHKFDFVVAADGLHSGLRNIVFPKQDILIRNLGACLCTFTMPNIFDLKHWELAYQGAGKLLNVYSLAENEDAKVFMLFTVNEQIDDYRNSITQKKIITEKFSGDGWKAKEILEAMHQAPDFYFDTISQVHMNTLSTERVVLIGDAGYCPSPASGQGSSMALVGAYILAGELATAREDYRFAFSAYEREMLPYISVNQELGVQILKEMIPKSKIQVWFQTRILSLILKLPWREQLFRSMLKKVQGNVNRAANAIRLKSYFSDIHHADQSEV